MNNQITFNNSLPLEVEPGYFDASLTSSYLTTDNFFSNEYCLYTIPIIPLKPNFNNLGNIEYENMYNNLFNSIFESNYNGFYNPTNPLTLISPIVKSNDMTPASSRRNSGFSMDSFCSKATSFYQCDVCNKIFDRKFVLKRHRASHNLKKDFYCLPCSMSFYRKDIYDRHLSTKKCRKAHQSL